MDLTSLKFFGFVLVGLALFNLHRSPAYRGAVFAALNLTFIASYVTDWWQLAPLAGFLVLGYVAVELVRRRPSGAMLAGCVITILVVYIYLKRFSFLGDLPTLAFPYLVVGLSYILFRVLHLVIDSRGGELPGRIGPLGYFNYTCNFLTFISGPIQRHEDVAGAAKADGLDTETVFAAFSRIATGFFKVLVLSGGANMAFDSLHAMVGQAAPIGFSPSFAGLYAATAVAYTLYLYFNFSGYMDIVIGVGALFGMTLPENFNRPFTARNFLEFWGRWHITLSDWFKFYLFNPLLKALTMRFDSAKAAPYIGVVAFFVTFLVMGVWHGTTAVFVIYGLIMGAGASANKLWQLWMTRRLGRKGYRELGERTAYIYACRGITFAYFAAGVTCLWVDMDELRRLADLLGVAGGAAAFAAIAITAAMFMWLWDRAADGLAGAIERTASLARSFVVRNAWLATRALLIVAITSFFHKSPEFVYKAF